MIEGVGAYVSTDDRVPLMWTEFQADRDRWIRRVRKAERFMTEAQGREWPKLRPKESPQHNISLIWTSGGPNTRRWWVIGFHQLQLIPSIPERPFMRMPFCGIPAGWRRRKDDDCLTPIPENGRKGGCNAYSGKDPEAIAARSFLARVQPPESFNRRLGEFGMPGHVFHELSMTRGPSMEVLDDGRFLLAWGCDHEYIKWDGGGVMKPLKTSAYYKLRGK